ncbi:MAG: hypothetical protein ABIF10_06210 [Candidatus Woesearchaeota archaeon]
MIILFEGTDLTGKSTLAEALCERLSHQRYKCCKRPILLKEGFFNEINKAVLKKNFLQPLHNIMFAFSMAYDGLHRQKDSSKVLIQDRYFPSLMSYARSKKQFGSLLLKLLSPMYINPDFCIMVTCSKEKRIRNYRERSKKCYTDTLVSKDFEFLLQQEAEIREILHTRGIPTIEIDTTHVQTETSLNQIISELKARSIYFKDVA